MSDLKVTGKVIGRLQEQSGRGNSGNEWRKQTFIVETAGQYPKKIAFDAWGDKVDFVRNLIKGETVDVFFNPESREWDGKWFTNLSAWKIDRVGAAAPPAASAPATPPAAPPTTPPSAQYEDDDLPF